MAELQTTETFAEAAKPPFDYLKGKNPWLRLGKEKLDAMPVYGFFNDQNQPHNLRNDEVAGHIVIYKPENLRATDIEEITVGKDDFEQRRLILIVPAQNEGDEPLYFRLNGSLDDLNGRLADGQALQFQAVQMTAGENSQFFQEMNAAKNNTAEAHVDDVEPNVPKEDIAGLTSILPVYKPS
jgi:hypothetical protein